ncbi:hypothetical protein BT96DRAFT_1000613 [Gymnopus androsaceus JB14]|uniref:DEAD/DEAH-box helicase domain-containing protein n=1 Tax=Gymnopus androsaceus JB14 TaxID=1447944 RepID=A0A6A4H3E5_9AGAR|nr:hypothetical protein BT96DRAFT_1000613 [Gymnopus androsaceus JB14]
MPPTIAFTSSEGMNIIESIVKKRVTKFPNGLCELQKICIPKILNQEDVFAINVTGGGKSALFAIPILIHLEINQNLTLYPIFTIHIWEKLVGIVVTPTKGLANDIVAKLMSNFEILAFAYTHDNVSAAWHTSIDLVKEITSCKYQLICMDPEHLQEQEWYLIANLSNFRQNIIFACTEEGHVIDEWGLGFHLLF